MTTSAAGTIAAGGAGRDGILSRLAAGNALPILIVVAAIVAVAWHWVLSARRGTIVR